jgi:hypothetical protein
VIIGKEIEGNGLEQCVPTGDPRETYRNSPLSCHFMLSLSDKVNEVCVFCSFN